jgi:hypothetical protein
MTDAVLALGGVPAVRCLLTVPPIGPWYADVDLIDDTALSGRVTLEVGGLSLSGTVDARHDGTQGVARRTRVVAGGGSWGRTVAAKHYHNDAGVRALLVAQDAAREAGEELGTFSVTGSVGVDYVRSSGAASLALVDVIGSTPWWVDFAGLTQVTERTTSPAAAGAYVLEAYDPRARVATLAVDDLTAIGIGTILSEGLDAPQTVRELTIDVSPESTRVRAWCGTDTRYDRIGGLLRALVERVVDERQSGPVKYRVSRMNVDRVELQLVNRRAGLPDLLPISMWPGVAGVHAQLTPGAEVLVEFVDGDRSQPIITHFAGKGGAGWSPVELVLDGTTVKIGAAAASPIALKSDLVALKSAISGAGVTAGDGGSAFKTALLATLNTTGWPTCSAKGKA